MRRLIGSSLSKNRENGKPNNSRPDMSSKFPSTITNVRAAQRLDSRGKPTVQVWVTTNKGSIPMQEEYTCVTVLMVLHRYFHRVSTFRCVERTI